MLAKLTKQLFAFLPRQLGNGDGVAGVDVERLPPGSRIATHQRVDDIRVEDAPAVGQLWLGRVAIPERLVVLGKAVHRMQVLDAPAKLRPQRVIGLVHVGEQRVGPFRRALDAIKQRADRWIWQERLIGVPQPPDAWIADRPAVLLDVADDVDLGPAGHLILLLRHLLQRAEPAAEADVRLWIEHLAPEQQNAVLVERVAQRRDGGVAYGGRRVKTDHLDSHGAAQRPQSSSRIGEVLFGKIDRHFLCSRSLGGTR